MYDELIRELRGRAELRNAAGQPDALVAAAADALEAMQADAQLYRELRSASEVASAAKRERIETALRALMSAMFQQSGYRGWHQYTGDLDGEIQAFVSALTGE